MSRTAFILTKPDGDLYNINGFAAYEGFTELGYTVHKFRMNELSTLPLTTETVVHATIGIVRKALQQIGALEPEYINVPPSVISYLGRRSWATTIGAIRTMEDAPVFIKPLTEGKIFNGHVVRTHRDLIDTAPLSNDYPVLAQESVTFLSEWRTFVLRGEILGIGHYKGDPLLFPDRSYIVACIADYRDPIVAHSADFGVTEDGRTLLVEMNDAHSLGSYGLPPIRYARMIEARWKEMATGTRIA